MYELSRRDLLVAAGASGLVAFTSPLVAEAATDRSILTAARGQAQLLPSPAPATAIWGFGGGVPGPVLRLRQGEAAAIRLQNNLPQATTVHWHGLRIENAMDGVAGLTQDAVPPGESFDYRFTPPDAGTYWYHPHNRSWEQVARGLYGALIVEEPEPPQVDREVLMVIDDWRLGDDGQIDEASLGALRDWSHAGRLGNVLTINGLDRLDLTVKAGERLRLRLINTANARVMHFRFEDHEPQLIALDGQPVAPGPLPQGRIDLAPGQRADLILDMNLSPGAVAAITEVTGDGRLVAGSFRYETDDVLRENPLDAPMALPANGLPERFDLSGALEVDLLMEGGAMGGLQRAIYQGAELGMRELAGKGMVWAFNGVVGRSAEPFFEVARGRPVVVTIKNQTAWPHAMHFHGHHVRDVTDGATPGAWRDTVLLQADQEQRVAFPADNPGKWMLHCHMLEHQAAGMATWFNVQD